VKECKISGTTVLA